MIRFRYQPTFRDYLTFNFVALHRQQPLLLPLAAFLVVTFLMSPIMSSLYEVRPGAMAMYRQNIGVLIVPGLVLLMGVSTCFAAKRRWTSAAELREEREYEISEDGVRSISPTVSASLNWSVFKDADLYKGYVFLKTGQNQYHHFPIAVVPDKAAFMALVARKVRVSKRWKSV